MRRIIRGSRHIIRGSRQIDRIRSLKSPLKEGADDR